MPVLPAEAVRTVIDFAHDFPGSQTYVFHCHNLEHEDAGMMINFRVQARRRSTGTWTIEGFR